jgi:hypothetical protein
MASPFSADIIPLPLLGAKQDRSELPGSGPASVRPIHPEQLRRIFDDHRRLDRIQAREKVARHQRFIGVACCALSAVVVLYFIGQLLRAVLS